MILIFHCESFSRNIFQIRVKLSFFCNVQFEPLLEFLHLRKCVPHKSIWIELTKYFSFFQTHDVGFERLIKIIFGKHGGAVVVFSKPMVMVPSLFLIDKVPISSRNQFTSSSLRAASPSSSGSLATRNIRWPLQEQEWSKNLAQCGNIRILLSF